ncbi:hypothetical protein [Hymenobacter mucosus]|uniref:hypothetical protein n=1 Tax=Hymenobacter mucosus TaxID=1411120 RepID=UPI000B791384|nr:hypothetical protein [Hymenobacter mucosus]
MHSSFQTVKDGIHCWAHGIGYNPGQTAAAGQEQLALVVTAAACVFLPDADGIGFAFRVPYAGL